MNFKNQIKAALNIVVDYKSDIEIIDQLIELQDLQNIIQERGPMRKLNFLFFFILYDFVVILLEYHGEESS